MRFHIFWEIKLHKSFSPIILFFCLTKKFMNFMHIDFMSRQGEFVIKNKNELIALFSIRDLENFFTLPFSSPLSIRIFLSDLRSSIWKHGENFKVNIFIICNKSLINSLPLFWKIISIMLRKVEIFFSIFKE